MKHIIERKPELIFRHVQRYSRSLNHFPDRFHYLFFENPAENNILEHPAYLCPICVSKGIILFDEHFADNGADFTLDHFPPKSVGGSYTMLVCRKCNSDAGQFENDLKLKMEDLSFDKGIPTAKRKIFSSISNIKGSYPGTLTMGRDNKINISFKESEKIHSPLLDQWINRPVTRPDWKAEIKYFVAEEPNVTKSILKTAYLFCFQYWGYSFSFSHTAENIRQVLNGTLAYPLRHRGFWLTRNVNENRLPAGLCTLSLPRGIKCFTVNIVMVDKQTKHREVLAIIIPGPYQENWENLPVIDQLIEDDPNFDISMAHVNGNSVFDGELDGYPKSWENFLKP